MNFKSIYIALVAMLFAQISLAQRELLYVNVEEDTNRTKQGPNMRHFHQGFWGFGFIAGEAEKGDIKYGSSMAGSIGYRYKRRISNVNALGLDIYYKGYSYALKQNAQKLLPTKAIHKREVINFNNLGIGVYHRIHLSYRRGNMLKKYLDVGAYTEWVFAAANNYTDTPSNGNRANVKIRKLNYIEPYHYGVYARYGGGYIAITAAWRMTDIISDDKRYKDVLLTGETHKLPQLPQFTIGIEFQMYEYK